MITAQRGEQRVTRNSSFFKPSPSPPVQEETAIELGDSEPQDESMDIPTAGLYTKGSPLARAY